MLLGIEQIVVAEKFGLQILVGLPIVGYYGRLASFGIEELLVVPETLLSNAQAAFEGFGEDLGRLLCKFSDKRVGFVSEGRLGELLTDIDSRLCPHRLGTGE